MLPAIGNVLIGLDLSSELAAPGAASKQETSTQQASERTGERARKHTGKGRASKQASEHRSSTHKGSHTRSSKAHEQHTSTQHAWHQRRRSSAQESFTRANVPHASPAGTAAMHARTARASTRPTRREAPRGPKRLTKHSAGEEGSLGKSFEACSGILPVEGH